MRLDYLFNGRKEVLSGLSSSEMSVKVGNLYPSWSKTLDIVSLDIASSSLLFISAEFHLLNEYLLFKSALVYSVIEL